MSRSRSVAAMVSAAARSDSRARCAAAAAPRTRHAKATRRTTRNRMARFSVLGRSFATSCDMYYSLNMPRQNLGELEQVLLLALLRLGGESYGAAVRAEILERTGRSITPGAIYPTLDRLERRGLLRSRIGGATTERGGRARRYFKVTAAGQREIRAAWQQTAALADGLAVLEEGRHG